jgi:hypothetical protein
MVIYEWRDVMYLGKVTSNEDDSLPVRLDPSTDYNVPSPAHS